MSTSKKETKKVAAAGEKVAKKAGKAVAKKTEKKAEKKTAPKREFDPAKAHAFGIVREPVFTEKTERGAQAGKYTFYVDTSANKVQVAEAVQVLYGVVPVAVNIMAVKGKKVRSGRTIGRRKNRKKAVVTLKKGDSITVME